MEQDAKAIARKLIKEFEKMKEDGSLEEMSQILKEAEISRREEQRQHRPLFDRKFGPLAWTNDLIRGIIQSRR